MTARLFYTFFISLRHGVFFDASGRISTHAACRLQAVWRHVSTGKRGYRLLSGIPARSFLQPYVLRSMRQKKADTEYALFLSGLYNICFKGKNIISKTKKE